tara:strand:- start:334 stop:531 length:198 start_codon:yes stop_codon:yes gene_type:complete
MTTYNISIETAAETKRLWDATEEIAKEWGNWLIEFGPKDSTIQLEKNVGFLGTDRQIEILQVVEI